MKHVTGRLAAWVGGELGDGDAANVEAHLAACPDCRREAEQTRAAWVALALVGADRVGREPDLWPAVRRRTFGQMQVGWFFGRSPAARWSLAVATLAVGVLCGRLTGSLPGPRTAVADQDSGLAAVWLEESTWHDETGGGLTDTWLAVAGTDGASGDSHSRGGTK